MKNRKSQITPSLHILNPCWNISTILHCFNNGKLNVDVEEYEKNDANMYKP